MTFVDDFERVSLGPNWADDGPVFEDWSRADNGISSGAWVADENNSNPPDPAMGSIRHVPAAGADQFVEAVVGNFFQGHDPATDDQHQWVEGDVYLFCQLDGISDAGIGVDFIIHANTGKPDGEAFVQLFTTDTDGTVTFVGDGGSYEPLPSGWESNPDYTIRLEVSAAGHCRAYFEGVLVVEDDATPVGGNYLGVGMQWNRTDYVPPNPNPGVSLRFESVTGSAVVATGWRVGTVGWGTSAW